MWHMLRVQLWSPSRFPSLGPPCPLSQTSLTPRALTISSGSISSTPAVSPDLTPPGRKRKSIGRVIPTSQALSKDNNEGLKDLDRKELAAVMMERKKIIREHNVKVKERLHKDTEKLKKDDSNTVLKCPECGKDVHRGSLRRHREELCLKSRL